MGSASSQSSEHLGPVVVAMLIGLHTYFPGRVSVLKSDTEYTVMQAWTFQ